MTTTADEAVSTNGSAPAPAPDYPPVPGSTPRLNAALAAFQAEYPIVTKGETAKVEGQTKDGRPVKYSYDYAGLDAVSEAAMPLLGKHGLAFTCWPTIVDGRFSLIYELTHSSGEQKSGVFPLPSQTEPQKMGGLLTYYRRYALQCVTGIAPRGEDNDAQDANQTQRFDRYGSAGESFENATPAAPRGQRSGQQRPERPAEQAAPAVVLDPDDAWKPAIDGITSRDDGLKVWGDISGQLARGELSQVRADYLGNAVRTRMAQLKQAAATTAPADGAPAGDTPAQPPAADDVPVPDGPADEQAGQGEQVESVFVATFTADLAAAENSTAARDLLRTLGPAIRERQITPAQLKDLQMKAAQRAADLADAERAAAKTGAAT